MERRVRVAAVSLYLVSATCSSLTSPHFFFSLPSYSYCVLYCKDGQKKNISCVRVKTGSSFLSLCIDVYMYVCIFLFELIEGLLKSLVPFDIQFIKPSYLPPYWQIVDNVRPTAADHLTADPFFLNLKTFPSLAGGFLINSIDDKSSML